MGKSRGIAKGIFMWKHIIIFVCAGGGMEIVSKLPQGSGARIKTGGAL